jgi:hypothetical protein
VAEWNRKEWRGRRITLQIPWPGKLFLSYGHASYLNENEYQNFLRGENYMQDRSKYFQGGNFLKAADIKDGQLVTIEKFEEAKTRLGTRPILRLKGIEQPFGLNATNFDRMIEKFGESENSWAGKKIRLVLRMAANPQKGGKEQPSIRIE